LFARRRRNDDECWSPFARNDADCDAVESIVFERDDTYDVIAMTNGEFGPHSARLGRGGIRELL